MKVVKYFTIDYISFKREQFSTRDVNLNVEKKLINAYIFTNLTKGAYK